LSQKLLIIGFVWPEPKSSAAGSRMLQLINMFKSADYDITFATACATTVLFDRFMIEEQFGWRVAEQCPNALRVLDTEDLHCLRKGRQQALKDQAFFDKSYLQNETAKREIASVLRCDLTFMISQVEIEILVNQFKINEHLLYYLPFLLEPITKEEQKQLPNYKDRNHFITIGNFML